MYYGKELAKIGDAVKIAYWSDEKNKYVHATGIVLNIRDNSADQGWTVPRKVAEVFFQGDVRTEWHHSLEVLNG